MVVAMAVVSLTVMMPVAFVRATIFDLALSNKLMDLLQSINEADHEV